MPLVRQRILNEISAHIPQDIPKVDASGVTLTLEQRLQLAKEKGSPISIDRVLGSLVDEIENPFRARLDAATGKFELIEPGLRYQLSKFPPFEKMSAAERTQYLQITERFRIATKAADYLRLLTTHADRALDEVNRDIKRATTMQFTPLQQGPQPPRHATA
jgi:hypothetical protein